MIGVNVNVFVCMTSMLSMGSLCAPNLLLSWGSHNCGWLSLSQLLQRYILPPEDLNTQQIKDVKVLHVCLGFPRLQSRHCSWKRCGDTFLYINVFIINYINTYVLNISELLLLFLSWHLSKPIFQTFEKLASQPHLSHVCSLKWGNANPPGSKSR